MVAGTVVLDFVAYWVVGVGFEVDDLEIDVLPCDTEVSSDDLVVISVVSEDSDAVTRAPKSAEAVD